MLSLVLHETCAAGPVRSVTANICKTQAGYDVEFQLVGEMSRIKIPPNTGSARADELWKNTCCEVFWQADGGADYYEFNLSPSGQWAAYHFDDIRKGMRTAPVNAMAIACSHNDEGLIVKASVAADLAVPAKVALTMVIEDIDANIQYWALAFPAGKPDFHSEVCRMIRVEQPV